MTLSPTGNMNARITQLVNNPESFIKEDLILLQTLLKEHPYVQSLRALQLFGTQRFNIEEYQEVLSKTAAYTTDKKILYQFINKSVTPEPKDSLNIESQSVTSTESIYQEVVAEPKPMAGPVYVNGELNRILFEGEEDFLEETHAALDLSSTFESGILVVQKSEPVSNEKTDAEPKDIQISAEPEEGVTEATEIPSENIPEKSEEPVIETITPENTAQVSFHGTSDFLPEVKMPVQKSIQTVQPAPVKSNKHEEEMQRLIAEVEAKMKASKKARPQVSEDRTANQTETNFENVQEFIISEDPEEKTTPETPDETATPLPETPHTWKPMHVETHQPDALIGKTAEEKKPEDKNAAHPTKNEEKTEERPVFNLSFFTQQVASLEITPEVEHAEPVITVDAPAQSNIPSFINTWQKWLKIEKNETDEKLSKEEEKTKIIEEFIVKEPKISKLKEDTDFVVKDRGDNISHLMTETLARLYTEQKLYSKAINAYHILTEKYPDRKSTYDEHIQMIKNLRLNK